MRRQRAESAISALRRHRRILLHGDESHVVELQRLQIDGFLDQVAILIADVLKLWRRNAHVECAARGMAVAGGLQPGLERLANHLFFQGCENLQPGIESRSRRNCKCHRANPCLRHLWSGRAIFNRAVKTMALAVTQGEAHPSMCVLTSMPVSRWSAPESHLRGTG